MLFTIQIYSQGCYYPASFSYTNNGAGNVSFVNTSTYISASSWDFGDGNISTQNHPTHTYTSNGYYTVTLDLTYVFNMGVYIIMYIVIHMAATSPRRLNYMCIYIYI